MMRKLLILVLLVTVLKCNGQTAGNDGFSKKRQAQGALGFASNILGTISSGFGLNFGGQLGFNTQNRPEENFNGMYPHRPQSQEDFVEQQTNENYNVPTKKPHHGHHHHRPPPPPPHRPPPINHHHQRPEPPPHHGRPEEYGPGYEQHGQSHEYPNQNNNQNYNSNGSYRPGRPSQHQQGHFNNNGNYGNQYPNNQNAGNYQGFNNQGFNNNGRPSSGGSYNDSPSPSNNNQFNQNTQPATQIPNNNNQPGFGNNNPYDENNQEYLSSINNVFGNNPQNSNGLNSGPQNSFNGGLVTGTQNSFNEGLTSGTQSPNNGGFGLGNPNQFGINPNQKPNPSSPFSPSFNAVKPTEENKEDSPTFVALDVMDVKRETEIKKPVAEDEEFSIDIRGKE